MKLGEQKKQVENEKPKPENCNGLMDWAYKNMLYKMKKSQKAKSEDENSKIDIKT